MFTHPWAIAIGALAAAMPVLIHWLTRPRPVRVPLSTLRFVRQAVEQKKARHRLRDFLVLALRTAAILLIAAAIARPLIGRSETAASDDAADVLRVVILDRSQSMAALSGGVRAFDRARPVAAKHLEYRQGLKANLLLAGVRTAAVFGRPSTNFAALQAELSSAAPAPEELDAQRAINAAAEMLAQGDAGARRELVVISDFQRTNWAAANFAPLPADTVITLESTSVREGDSTSAAGNLAILRVAAQGRLEVGRDATLEVEVGNYSSAPRNVRVDVAFGDASYQLEGLCPPFARTTLTTTILPRQPGWQTGRAQLVDPDGGGPIADALPDDNTRPCVLNVQAPPHYALVTRQRRDGAAASSFYLERGLAPFATDAGGETARVLFIDPLDADPQTLARAELIVVDHPGRLPDEMVNRLAGMLRRGRGLLYVAAEPADAVNLRNLAAASGGTMQLPVEFVPAAQGRLRQNLFLAEFERGRAPFAVFGDDVDAVLASIRVGGGLSTRQVDGALGDDVLATLSDRSAFLVKTSSSAGTLAVLNADLDESNLAQSPAFVPLLGELMQQLAGAGSRVDEFAPGTPVDVYLPDAAAPREGLELIGPPDETASGGGFLRNPQTERRRDAQSAPVSEKPAYTTGDLGFLKQESGGLLWHIDAAGKPGVYQALRNGETVFAMTAAVPAAESDLRPLDPDVFRERLSGDRVLTIRAASIRAGEEQDTLWPWLAVACVGCLMSEVVALKRFRT